MSYIFSRHQAMAPLLVVILLACSLATPGYDSSSLGASPARVLKQQRKNVHAFARGTMVPSVPALDTEMNLTNWVYYNPYRGGTFINPPTSQAVKVSQYARLTMRYHVTTDSGVARAYAVNLEGGA